MTGINKAPISLDLVTEFIQARADVQPQPIGKGKIVAVIFQNRLNNINATNNGNNSDIMIGYGSGQIWQLLPGQESPVIYANDLEDVYLRLRLAAGTPCDVAVIVYKERNRR